MTGKEKQTTTEILAALRNDKQKVQGQIPRFWLRQNDDALCAPE
jgi:hypothetical protein